MDNINNGHAEYINLFQNVIRDLDSFLKNLFSTFSTQWQNSVVLMRNDTGEKLFENKETFAPLCRYIREELNMGHICHECDQLKAKEAAERRGPIEYWCDCGLRDIAVPILIQEYSVGTIFCGQKILEDKKADTDGERKLIEFARDNNLERLIDTLIKKRDESKKVSGQDIEQMKKLLWTTSEFFSQMLYNNLKERSQVEKNQLINKLLDSLTKLRTTSNVHRFWADYRSVLRELVDLLSGRLAVVLIFDKKIKVEFSSTLKYKVPENFDKEQLITVQVAGPGPQQTSDIDRLKSCPICRYVIERNPGINMALFEKSQLELEKEIHLLVFFDSTTPSRVPFYPHEKAQILSQLILETIKVYIHLNEIQQLKKSLKERDEFLKDVAHQIRQPLHSIVGYCDNLILDLYPPERKERIPVLVREIAFQCTTLAKCIEYAARGEKNIFATEEIKPETHNLSRILIEFAINMQGYSEEQGIHIHVEDRDTVRYGNVKVDKFKLELAMSNVLYNAVKYSFPRTRVTVSAFRDYQNKMLNICIVNLGIEISWDKWDVIFNRGERTKLARQYSQSGLGIGLFVTREVMLAMGGDAKVLKSEPTGRSYQEFKEYENTIVLALPDAVIIEK